MGIKVAQASRPIFHILFADDSLFFCKEKTTQCDAILQILTRYGNASGRRITLTNQPSCLVNESSPRHVWILKGDLEFQLKVV